MSFPFNPAHGLVIIAAQLWGPAGDTVARLALDTGATMTTVSASVLATVGYDPSISPSRVRMTTGSGVEDVPIVLLSRIEALGHTRASLSVLAHTLPPSAGIDGLPGLDFLRGQLLTIDFRIGEVALS
jgi:predicted aspartyl protease